MPAGALADGGIVGHHDQGDAARVEVFEHLDHFLPGVLVEVAGGFVGQQQIGFGDRGAGDGDALALAAGELIRLVPAAFGQSHFPQGRGDPLAAGFRLHPGQHQRQFHVFEGRQARHQVKGLKHEADVAVAGGRLLFVVEGGDVLAIEKILAAAGAVQQAEQVEQGGLAGAGGPHDGNIFTRVDVEADIVEGVDGLFADLKIAVDVLQADHALVQGAAADSVTSTPSASPSRSTDSTMRWPASRPPRTSV